MNRPWVAAVFTAMVMPFFFTPVPAARAASRFVAPGGDDTRSGLDWTDRFGTDLLSALTRLPVDQAILDGELVVETDAGASDFRRCRAI